MIKQRAAIEIQMGERNYLFLCENGSPAGEVYDVLTRMRSKIFEMIVAEEERSKAKEKSEEKPCDCGNDHC